ncbi:HAD family hydrolase [Thermodesulfobacteriota bacterium]
MLNAILFDLDNTLILFDEAKFYQGYFKQIEPLFADIMKADKFRERLINATRALMQNTGEMKNAEYFLNAFAEGYTEQRNELWKRFLSFYDNEYDKLDANVKLPNNLHETMAEIFRTGLKRVLASNPIFPLSVQMKRLDWAGLGHLSFDLVTHIENMSFCKPRIEYYLEICRKIDEPPEACLMVGNDPVNDMVAGKAGLKTYLTDDAKGAGRVTSTDSKDFQRHQIAGIPEPDFMGPISDVIDVIQHHLHHP